MPNGPNPTKLEMLQRQYTEAYKVQLEIYRNSRILWAIITSEGYIIVTNPYWSELGYTPSDLHWKSLYGLFPVPALLSNLMMNIHIQSIGEQPMKIFRKGGELQDVLCWMSTFVEKSTGAWVANFSAVLRDE
jgi:hypothetical protein